MIHLSEKISVVEVPLDANIQICNKRLETTSKTVGLKVFFFNHRYRIIGTVSADTIDFDCEPYVEKDAHFGRKYFKDYDSNYKNVERFRANFTANDSFRSLLNSKGARWVNPYPKPFYAVTNYGASTEGFKRYERDFEQWQAAEQSLIKGKGVVLERI